MKQRFTFALDFTMTSIALTDGRSGSDESVLLGAVPAELLGGALARPEDEEGGRVGAMGSSERMSSGNSSSSISSGSARREGAGASGS